MNCNQVLLYSVQQIKVQQYFLYGTSLFVNCFKKKHTLLHEKQFASFPEITIFLGFKNIRKKYILFLKSAILFTFEVRQGPHMNTK